MKRILSIFAVICVALGLTACNARKYQPKKLTCVFEGQDVVMEPVYNVYTSDGHMIWYTKDNNYKKHYPSTDCMVRDASPDKPWLIVEDKVHRLEYIGKKEEPTKDDEWPKK